MTAVPKHLHRLLILFTVLAVSACAYPTRNAPLEEPIDQDRGYRGYQVDDGPLARTLVIVTVSGGGTRAAALGYGAMQALANVRLRGGDDTLLHAVDIVSSVSGGSVPAAYLAAVGPEGLPAMEDAFLHQDGIGRLLWRGLNPYGLAQLSTPAVERIDMLIRWFDDALFAAEPLPSEGITYADLRDPDAPNGWRRPFLILNAADMTQEQPFAFHQDQFDLLCSDLEQLPLSVGVAASAAFPVALSPVTLVNYTEPGGCEAQRAAGDDVWPPAWIGRIDTSLENGTISPRTHRARVRRARVAASYYQVRDGELVRPYIHLLDGGIAENLGVAEPLRLLTTRERTLNLLSRFDRGDINRVLFLVVNARSDAATSLDRSKATPGMLDMLNATTGSAIDNATYGTLEGLQQQIRSLMRAPTLREQLTVDTAYVDFDLIDNSRCRQAFRDVATSWTLPENEVHALIRLAEAMIWLDPGFRTFTTRLGDEMLGPAMSEPAARRAKTTACRMVGAPPESAE
ncbi:patatin-like phospholipase family protein [Ectothiorhodospiraceae bacterium WFHF3C12]|nr:patatin-like phospholipase family protein [Ectothiorhodospiraceae bacterium WFHF3C12]